MSQLAGSDRDVDGLFFVNSYIRPRQISDCLSNTVAISESTLGPGGPGPDGFVVSTPPGDLSEVWAALMSPDLSESNCDSATAFGVTRGNTWAATSHLSGFFNAYLPPNASRPDCIAHFSFSPGWVAARSRHPGGVNSLFADGSVVLTQDGVDMLVWGAIAARHGRQPQHSLD